MERIETKGLSWSNALLATAILMIISVLAARGIIALQTDGPARATLLPCSAHQTVKPLGSGVIYADNTHLHALNPNGRQRWNYMVGTGLNYEVSDGGVAAWAGSSISLLDGESGTPRFSGVMDAPVISAVMGSEYAAVLTGEDEQNSTLIVMDHNGREIDEISMPNLTVLQYGFFNKGRMLWVMSIDTEGTVPMSQLVTYKPGRMLSGNITDSDQVVYQVMFDSPNVYTIGTTYMRVYDYTGVENTAERSLIYGWYLMDQGALGSDVLMAFAPMAQVGSQFSVSDVRMICGSTDRTVHLPYPCYELAVRNGKVYGFSEQFVMSYGLNDTKATITQLPMPCSDMLGITGNNEAILVSGNSVYLVALP